MIKFVITFPLLTLIQAAYYNCTILDDTSGIAFMFMDTKGMFECDNCDCIGLRNNTCQFRPRDDGPYITQKEVPAELADKCITSPTCACNEDMLEMN